VLTQEKSTLVLSFREAWHLSGLGRDYLLQALHEGRLHAIRCGRVWRIPRRELELFIEREAVK
jgi:excisionase family DNA binding protein